MAFQKNNKSDADRLDTLSGQIERITYVNEENGYTVAKLKVYGQRDLVTIVGNLMSPSPGEILKIEGVWSTHPTFGEQFKVVKYHTKVPANVYGIKKYLGSGMVKGLGPKIAERIVKSFGKATLEVIEHDIDRLFEVDGVGKKRVAMIKTAWAEQKEIREVMVFLQSHGVSSGYAVKIFKQYGERSIDIVKENPYRLATDIFGIGFITADHIAEKLGFSKDSPLRIRAGILYVLLQLSDDGHFYYPYEPLIEKAVEILEVEKEGVADAIAAMFEEKRVVIEDLNGDIEPYKANHKAVYLAKYHLCETRIAANLKQLAAAPDLMPTADKEAALRWVQKKLSITLAENQAQAIKVALSSKVMVITGGPGTGKTTIINAILQILSRLKIRIMLAAPTGRAAKRMKEATGFEAKTIHRLLDFSMAKGGFKKDGKHPLKCDLLVIDEASMVDTILMHHLVKAIPMFSSFILVGDVNQLPSVGAGNVLKDIIQSGAFHVVALNEIFRQAKKSRIIVNAHRINSGQMPFTGLEEKDTDFYFIKRDEPEPAVDTILELVKNRIPARFGYHPMDDIQVLTPMHKGIAGAGNLNMALQAALNPGIDVIARGNRRFRENDKVMQIRNNYDKEVFNGDIGSISTIDPEAQKAWIVFDDRKVPYDFSDLDELVLAYAVSVHKSQGSEYPAVVMPVLTQHYILLQRNLIYTALTRGKNLVVMVGSKKALAIAVNNNKTHKRYTRLAERLE